MRIVSETELIARLEQAGTTGADCPRVVVSGNHATPYTLLRLADKALERYRLFMLNAQPGIPVRDGVVHETPFVGPGMRGLPSLRYLPARLSLVPELFGRGHRPDIVLVRTSVPRGGWVSLGIEINVLPAAIDAARTTSAGPGLVVAQIDPAMPYTFGAAEIPLDHIDLAIESAEPLPAAEPRAPRAEHDEIAARVARLIGDGATIQAGIGGIPDAVLAALRPRRGLTIWSEMISDGVLGLARSGALNTDRPIVTSFLFGSPELYAWADRNPLLHTARTETTNNPAYISRQPAMTSINTALQVDLYAQANASYVRRQIYSGFGGQTDFIVGALHSPGGQAVIALPSWHAKTGTSTIVPRLDTPVTSFQHTAIVTEHGTASLVDQDQPTQTDHLIAIAHPDARDALRTGD